MPVLTVEDGTSVANANSYIDLVYLAEYATNRGLTLPADDTVKEEYVLLAADYLENLRDRFQGSKVASDQAMQWPRTDVVIDGNDFAEDAIPVDLKKAQAQLVIEQANGHPLYPQPKTKINEGLVVEKSVGPLKKRFAHNTPGGNVLANPNRPIKFAAVEMFLKPLMNGGTFGRLYKV